jgi:carbon-monoxide dehydrogenase small subunit
VKLTVNGQAQEVNVSPWKRVLDVLREDLQLCGTKEGCGEGECGACTILIDGEPANSCPANSCLVAVGQIEGREVVTVEGLAPRGELSPLQEALCRVGGTQCGICTPGIAICAAYVLKTEPRPPRERIRELLAGNICRCTGYQGIIDAVEEVSRR